jgi:adenylate cyclase
MVEHAFALLRAVGYGSADGPFTEVGIGLDIGDAFVGNIGERAVYDFTAVGDVVNTAARLEAQARGGEILLSDRVAAGLQHPPGIPCELQLKGKQLAQRCHRASVRTTP